MESMVQVVGQQCCDSEDTRRLLVDDSVITLSAVWYLVEHVDDQTPKAGR